MKSDPESKRKRRLHWRIARRVVIIAGYGVAIIATFILVRAFAARGMPELHAWHRHPPKGEFRARDLEDDTTLDDYLAVEKGLFDQIPGYELDPAEAADQPRFTRYVKGSVGNPRTFDHDWNRTTELVPETVRGGVLLLHGCSDSPYSLRAVAEQLRSKGFYALCLRLPGHGTVPAGLKRVRWEAWDAAVRVGARHVATVIGPDQPFLVCGYSLGGSLALKLAMDVAAGDTDVRRPDRLLLFSPCIGVSAFARLSLADQSLSFIPYFERSAWLNVDPEYDPFKYQSFAEHAGYEMWQLTRRNHKAWVRLCDEGKLDDFPPVTAFQSAVDSTVLTSGLLAFFRSVPSNGSELVVFDVNHSLRLDSFFRGDPGLLTSLLDDPAPLAFDLTVVTNADGRSREVVARRRAAGAVDVEDTPLGLSWPEGIMSLGHVAIPFPPSDRWYGDGSGVADEPDVPQSLGNLVVRIEKGVLSVSLDTLMRTRYNPFFSVIEKRIEEAISH